MNDLAIRNVDDLARISQMVCAARLFDCQDAAQAGAKIMSGAEIGLGPIASMQSIILVKGRPTLKASAWAGLIKRSGRYDYRYTEWTDCVCTIEFTDNGKPCGVSTFTMDDAKRAGLTGDNWRKFPKAMLSARAMTQGARAYCPDVSMGGMYTPDELDDAYDDEPLEITDSPQPPSGNDGGPQEADSGTDAAPSPEELYSDTGLFMDTVNGYRRRSDEHEASWRRLKEEEGYTNWDSVPVSDRPLVIKALEGVSG